MLKHYYQSKLKKKKVIFLNHSFHEIALASFIRVTLKQINKMELEWASHAPTLSFKNTLNTQVDISWCVMEREDRVSKTNLQM